MEMNRFEQLVKQENGFEFCIGFRDEVDWIIGGKGNRFWFVIRKDGSIKETTEAEIHDSVWKDRMYKGSKKKISGRCLMEVRSAASRKPPTICRTWTGS